MFVSPTLAKMLSDEALAGNAISGEYKNEFQSCKTLIVLRDPFRVAHAPPAGIDAFVNRDSHYPVGRGYKDLDRQEILLAPF
jgi:hypothetical protein